MEALLIIQLYFSSIMLKQAYASVDVEPFATMAECQAARDVVSERVKLPKADIFKVYCVRVKSDG